MSVAVGSRDKLKILRILSPPLSPQTPNRKQLTKWINLQARTNGTLDTWARVHADKDGDLEVRLLVEDFGLLLVFGDALDPSDRRDDLACTDETLVGHDADLGIADCVEARRS